MAEKISYQKCTNADEAYAKVKSDFDVENIKRKYNITLDLDYNETGKNICANGRGFKVEFNFKPDHVDVHIDLAFMLRPFKGKIWSELERSLQKIV